MGRFVALVALALLSGLLLALGGWLTYFGLGARGDGTSRSWATLGPLLAGFGVALVIVTVNRGRNK